MDARIFKFLITWNAVLTALVIVGVFNLSTPLVNTAVAATDELKCIVVGEGLLPGGKKCKKFTLAANFTPAGGDNGAATTVARGDHTHPGGSSGDITGVTAGDGLAGGGSIGDVTLSANFAGSGAANTVARSDHNHDATYVNAAGDAMTGDLTTTGMLKAGAAPWNEYCNRAGDVCAGDDVSANDDVLANNDVMASNRVKAGSAWNANCNVPGDVCAGHNVFAEYEVYAQGDVKQSLTGDGTVKAAVATSCGGATPPYRYFNNVNDAAITVTNGGNGICTINFGFDITGRYIVATAYNGTGTSRVVTISLVVGNTATFRVHTTAGSLDTKDILVLVY